jgi:hypothetical protein
MYELSTFQVSSMTLYVFCVSVVEDMYMDQL